MIRFFTEGFLLGLAYAMPIGSQNIFLIRSALSGDRVSAYFTASCVSIMDVSLGLSCFFGVSKILEIVPGLKPALVLIGSFYLLYIALTLIRSSKNDAVTSNQNSLGFRQIIVSAFVLTWFNPQAIIDGSVILGGFSAKLTLKESISFLLGMVIASPAWFFSVTVIARRIKLESTSIKMTFVSHVAASILLLIALKTLFEFARQYAQ